MTVSKRCVFYVSGFDPKGASHYHALYRDQGTRKSRQDGWHLEVGPRRRQQTSGSAAWSVQAGFGEQHVQTHYEFMSWDDVVRRHWPKTTWTIWWDAIATTIFYVRHGTLWKMFCLSWPFAVALFVPFLLVCAMLLGIPLLTIFIAWVSASALEHTAAGMIVAGLVAGALWTGGRKLEARYSMYWMMRSYAFTARQARGEVPDLEVRLDELAQRLVERIQSQQDDEVLVVGHSSGAIMATIILARALKLSPDLLRGRTAVSLLTLGQCIPLLGLLPMAYQFREELQILDAGDGLTWTDFSAPPDGCCFALTDPVTACGIPRRQAHGVNLKILNPRFAALFDPVIYEKLKRNKNLMHFQYLHATEKHDDYNYFEITAGPVTLKKRFAAVASIAGYTGLRPFR
ncbi:hypothetical protein [Polaromonas sp. JS666]|uniref:hypothetical protein n=1 Tax=Polaromonas sp. (strain JS666 / ATCC BAA-500) TaxID=296591 RepID=UPI00005354CE|nr:hypothetical protein [Polaromonas sp. JS666]ABE46792.1 conserved hypothetical protein [Polaromonas sp. JS666]